MSSSAFHGIFDIHHSSSTSPVDKITSPPPTHQKTKAAPPSPVGLDELTFGARYNGPDLKSGAQSPIEHEPPTPISPNELEMSRPPSSRRDEAVEMMQSWNNPRMNIWRIASCCLIYFGNGINDSVVGALIPYMEVYYHLGYAVISLVFVGNAAGFIVAAFFTHTILDRLGRAKTLILSELIILSAYIMLVVTPPYPVVVVAFFLLGYGIAINLALNNVFCANLNPSSTVLGAAHGSYGVGGIVAPIIGTVMVSKGGLWSRFYFFPLGLRFFCIALAGWAFWSYDEDSSKTLMTALERTASRQAAAEPKLEKVKNLKSALMNKVTIFGALFIFAYQGAEVSISGWVISFLINYRNGDPASVGYVTSGFWAGITIGRFLLTHLTPRYIGTKLFVSILTTLCIGLQLLAWLIPNIIGDAVAVCILGLLLGPVYPCAQTIFTRLIPRDIQTTAVGFIGGAGSSGGAVAPFTTGLLAQASGTWVLHPVCVGMYVVMLACWAGLPRMRKRSD